MNHRAIVLRQYQDRATKLRAELADVETAVRLLGGEVNSSVPVAKAKRKGGGWPKGKPRPRKAPKSPAIAKSNGPAMSKEKLDKILEAIAHNDALTPIEKAHASNKARADFARKSQGAGLAEAAGD